MSQRRTNPKQDILSELSSALTVRAEQIRSRIANENESLNNIDYTLVGATKSEERSNPVAEQGNR